MVEPKSGRPRIAELDGLRGIAALWVVFFHFTTGVGAVWNRIDPAIAPTITPTTANFEGVAAVWLFFMVSGFVIFMTLQRCRSILDFAVSRIARLYPAYWVSVAIAAGCILASPLPGETISTTRLLANLTMLQQFIGFDPIAPAYWSLSVELAFYGWMAVLFLLGGLRRVEILGLVFVLVTALANHALPGMLPWRLRVLLLIPEAPLFLCGIVLYHIATDGFSLFRAIILAICLGLFMWGRDPVKLMLITVIFAVFAAAVLGYAPLLRVTWLRFLGRISYAVYLIHGPVGARAQLWLASLGAPPLLNLLVAIATVIVAAWLLNLTIEVPVGRFIRSLRPAPAPPAPG